MIRLRSSVLFLALIACSTNSSKAAGILYGVKSTGGLDAIYKLDQVDGSAELVTYVSGPSLVGATFLNGEFYVTNVNGRLGKFDLSTGIFTEISDQDGSSNWHGLASNESAGLLYSMESVGTPQLYSITPSGIVELIGSSTTIDGRGMAYDDTNGILYATNLADNSLYTVSTTTGAATEVGISGLGVSGNYAGLAYDEGGVLYALATEDNNLAPANLYTVNTSTGAATLVGATGFNMDGLAWIAEVPEPTTLAGLLSLGACGLIAGVRRRRTQSA